MSDYNNLSPMVRDFLGHADSMTQLLNSYENKTDMNSLSPDERMTHTTLRAWLAFLYNYLEDKLIQ